MNTVLWIRFLAFASISSALAFALVAAGCGEDVTGKPDAPVAANTEESTSRSAVTAETPAQEVESAPEESDAASEPHDDKAAGNPESGKQDPKYTGPPSAAGGMGGPGGEGQRSRRQGGMMRGAERLLEQLNLTDAQKEKIEAITAEATKQFQALRESQESQQGSLREKFQQLRDATMKKIEAVLTPEQRENLKKLQEEAVAQMRERMRQREQAGEGGQPGPGGSRSGG